MRTLALAASRLPAAPGRRSKYRRWVARPACPNGLPPPPACPPCAGRRQVFPVLPSAARLPGTLRRRPLHLPGERHGRPAAAQPGLAGPARRVGRGGGAPQAGAGPAHAGRCGRTPPSSSQQLPVQSPCAVSLSRACAQCIRSVCRRLAAASGCLEDDPPLHADTKQLFDPLCPQARWRQPRRT